MPHSGQLTEKAWSENLVALQPELLSLIPSGPSLAQRTTLSWIRAAWLQLVRDSSDSGHRAEFESESNAEFDSLVKIGVLYFAGRGDRMLTE